jgi:hypothetical protein
VPGRLTLAQIEDMIGRDEAQLTVYRRAIAEAEAEGLDSSHASGLARFVEERIALLNRAREARLSGEPAGEQQPS